MTSSRSPILDVAVRVVFPSAMVLSAYLLFAGHNQPGGGFIGGLVAGAAFALRYVAGGLDEVRAVSRVRPWLILGSGLLLAAGTALVPLVLGDAVLESAKVAVDLGPLGEAKATSAVVFDLGVYGVVVGLVLMIFEAFGEGQDEAIVPEFEAGPQR